jgi:hypothetical protein
MSEGLGFEPDFDYEAHYRRLEEAAMYFLLLLRTVDLKQLRAVLGSADTLGPFLDPTKYRDALQSGSLDKQRLLVVAATEFFKACEMYGVQDGRT